MPTSSPFFDPFPENLFPNPLKYKCDSKKELLIALELYHLQRELEQYKQCVDKHWIYPDGCRECIEIIPRLKEEDIFAKKGIGKVEDIIGCGLRHPSDAEDDNYYQSLKILLKKLNTAQRQTINRILKESRRVAKAKAARDLPEAIVKGLSSVISRTPNYAEWFKYDLIDLYSLSCLVCSVSPLVLPGIERDLYIATELGGAPEKYHELLSAPAMEQVKEFYRLAINSIQAGNLEGARKKLVSFRGDTVKLYKFPPKTFFQWAADKITLPAAIATYMLFSPAPNKLKLRKELDSIQTPDFLPHDDYPLRDAFNDLGRKYFQEAWTGNEADLSMELPLELRDIFIRNVQSSYATPDNLKKWTREGVGLNFDIGCITHLITVGCEYAKSHGLEHRLLNWEHLERNQGILPAAFRRKEHFIFLSNLVHGNFPDIFESVFKSYQRYFYTEVELKKILAKSSVKVRLLKGDGHYEEFPPHLWGATTECFCFSVASSTAAWEKEEKIVSGIIVLSEKDWKNSQKSNANKVKAETDCRGWLKREAKHLPYINTLPKLIEEFQKAYPAHTGILTPRSRFFESATTRELLPVGLKGRGRRKGITSEIPAAI